MSAPTATAAGECFGQSGSSPPPSATRLLTTGAVAALLGLTHQRLRVMRMAGKGPAFVKFSDSANGRCLYPEASLHAWLAALPRHQKTTGARVGVRLGARRVRKGFRAQ